MNRGMPWYKTLSRLHRDADYLGMSMPQQAVYRNLLDYANEQRERGAFSIKNRRVLALAVAMGDEQLLCDTLEYATHEWICEDGSTSIVIEGDTARFSQWARIQDSYPSDEPQAVAERVRKHRAKSRNEDVTRESIVTSSASTRRDKEEEKEKEAAGQTKPARDAAAAVMASLEIDPATPEGQEAGATIAAAVAQYPDAPHILDLQHWKAKNERWRRIPTIERADRYAKWLRAGDRLRLKDTAARASPNGREPPPALSTLPDDPDEDALWRQRDEELRAKAHERSRC